MLQQILLALNMLISLATVGFAIVAVVRPGMLHASPDGAEPDRYYPTMYAVRAVPLGLLAAVAPWLTGSAAPAILYAAAAAQVGDAALGARLRIWGQVFTPLFGAAVYIATALVLAY